MKKWWLIVLMWNGMAQAAHPDFLLPFISSDMPLFEQSFFEQSEQWIECSERISDSLWCSEEFQYYSTLVWAEVSINKKGQADGLTLHANYSRNDWSLFQLSLRKDGFQLVDAQSGSHYFSVSEMLKTSTLQATDKALILFLNQSNQQFPQRLHWQSAAARSELLTDGRTILLHFIHLE